MTTTMSLQHYSPTDDDFDPPADHLELSDYLTFDSQWPEDHDLTPTSMFVSNPKPGYHIYAGSNSGSHPPPPTSTTRVKKRLAFKVKSEMETMDDGFKWRKYGKKMVKNSPHPRNYYRCSVETCPVKKRVERDRDDPSFVITTYEGIHLHHTTF